MTLWTLLIAAEAAEATAEGGGLFDLDATLPLMAIQFVILVAILNVTFFKPLTGAIEGRADYIRKNRQEAEERLAKSKQLAHQYEQELADTRRQAQAVILTAEADAQKLMASKLAEAQQEAQQQREQAQREIDEQKQAALQTLESQIDVLSRQILDKLLGSSAAR